MKKTVDSNLTEAALKRLIGNETIAFWKVYVLLRDHELTARQVSSRLGISMPSVHRCIRNLKQLGLVVGENYAYEEIVKHVTTRKVQKYKANCAR